MSRRISVRSSLVFAALLVGVALTRAQTVEDKAAAALKKVDDVAARGAFTPIWNSLEGAQVPDWYQDAKFGIFIHWGVYSVPAFGANGIRVRCTGETAPSSSIMSRPMGRSPSSATRISFRAYRRQV